MQVFSVYFWHSERWTPRNEALLEAVVKRARATRHPWLIACDANMSPEDFEKSMWFSSRQMFVEAPKEVSTCRSEAPKGELIERTCDCVIASQNLKRKIINMEVVEDFESRPHEAVSFVIERDKEVQEWKQQAMPKALLGFSGGKLAGRGTAEKGREEDEEDEGSRKMQMKKEIAQEVIAGMDTKPTSQRTVEQRVKQNLGLFTNCRQR